MTSNNKPFAMFFNASPRKNWNTHKMLEAAKAGAEEAARRSRSGSCNRRISPECVR